MMTAERVDPRAYGAEPGARPTLTGSLEEAAKLASEIHICLGSIQSGLGSFTPPGPMNGQLKGNTDGKSSCTNTLLQVLSELRAAAVLANEIRNHI